MLINLTPNAIVDLLTLGMGLSFGLLLVFEKLHRPTLNLGVFLVATALTLVPILLAHSGVLDKNPSFLFLPISFYFATGPILYLYVKKVAGERNMAKDWKHLVPGAIEFLLFSVLFFLPPAKKAALNESVYYLIFYCLSILFRISYMWVIVRFVNVYQTGLPERYSELTSRSLGWLKRFAIAYSLLLVFALTLVFVASEVSLPINNLVFSVCFYFVHFSIITWAMRQPLSAFPHEAAAKAKGSPIKTNPVPKKVEFLEEDFRRLQEFMDREKPYLEPELNLFGLSVMVGMPHRYLSQLIKAHSEQNFNRFINTYRINTACEKLADPAFDHLTIMGIAYDSGFKSKSSFYATFQEIVGVSPAEYKERRTI